MEKHLDEELKELHKEILNMGILTQEAIYNSIEALKNRDKNHAQEIINQDTAIDKLESIIEEHCLDLIARYRPIATDLRFIATGMKINAELERIADLAIDICQRIIEIADKPLLKPLIDIPKLSVIAQNMIRDAIDSFVKKDRELAKQVALSDSQANQLHNQVQDELINDFMSQDASTASRAVPLLLITRHLEHICDHAANIAEDVLCFVEKPEKFF